MEDSKTLDISLEDIKISPELNPILKNLPKLRRQSNNSTCSLTNTVDSDNFENLQTCGSVCVYNPKQQLILNCEFCDLKYGDLDNFKRHLHEAHNLFQLDTEPEEENTAKKHKSSKDVSTVVKKEPLEPPIDLPSTYFTEPLVSCGAVFIFNQQKFHLACGYCDCSKYDNLDMFEKHVKQQHNILEGAHNELNVVPKVEVKKEVFLITEGVEPTVVKVEKEEPLEEGVLDTKQSYSEDEEEEDEEGEDDEESEIDEEDEEFIDEDDEEFIDENDEDGEGEEEETEDEQNTAKATKRKRQQSPSDEPSSSPSKKSKRKSKNDLTRYKCDIRSRHLTTRNSLNVHKKRHMGEAGKTNNCQYCDKKFICKSELIIHERVHTGEKPYKCKICNKTFTSPQSMYRHRNSHKDDAAKIFNCEHCDKKFARSIELLKHASIHSSEKLLQCDVCQVRFRFLKGLNTHKRRRHLGEAARKHMCKYCDKKFIIKSELVDHERNHTGERPYKCDICEKCFMRSSSLSRHKNIHTERVGQIFNCEHCDKNFTTYYGLQLHKSVYTSEKNFECDICHKYYKYKSTLYVHKKNKHREEKTFK